MAFRLPTFNLNVNIWRNGNAVTNPPDVQTAGNLVGGHHGFMTFSGMTSTTILVNSRTVQLNLQCMTLLLPKLADIRPPTGAFPTVVWGDCVEVPAGSLRYYAVNQVDDIGKGFANEHRFALLVPLTGATEELVYNMNWNEPPNWPTPIP